MIRTIDIPRDEAAPRTARHVLEELAPQLGPQVAEDARLLISELVTNSVRHGAGDDVRIVFDVPETDCLRCEVIDQGDGFVPVAREKDREEPGGWGLQLVEQLSRSWGVRKGSTHVWFELGP